MIRWNLWNVKLKFDFGLVGWILNFIRKESRSLQKFTRISHFSVNSLSLSCQQQCKLYSVIVSSSDGVFSTARENVQCTRGQCRYLQNFTLESSPVQPPWHNLDLRSRWFFTSLLKLLIDQLTLLYFAHESDLRFSIEIIFMTF